MKYKQRDFDSCALAQSVRLSTYLGWLSHQLSNLDFLGSYRYFISLSSWHESLRFPIGGAVGLLSASAIRILSPSFGTFLRFSITSEGLTDGGREARCQGGSIAYRSHQFSDLHLEVWVVEKDRDQNRTWYYKLDIHEVTRSSCLLFQESLIKISWSCLEREGHGLPCSNTPPSGSLWSTAKPPLFTRGSELASLFAFRVSSPLSTLRKGPWMRMIWSSYIYLVLVSECMIFFPESS